jgi:CheY-like chemotaxis protein
MAAVLLTADLACSSKVAGAAVRTGRRVEIAMSVAALIEKGAGAELVILDLMSPATDPIGLLPKLRALAPPPIIVMAFGPHVNEERLAAAREAGCDEVISRGQFHSRLDELLSKYVSG